MRVKTAILSCLAGAFILSVCYEAGFVKAESEPAKSTAKTGVVSIAKIFQDSKKVSRYRQQTAAERSKMDAEMERMAKEIEAEKAGLRTLKPGSSDYLKQMKEILSKQANSQVQEKFYEQQMALKEQEIVENTYQQILQAVKKVAEKRGFDMVLEKDEVDFPAMSINDAMMIIRTHKVLYSGGCADVTGEVLAELDKEK